MKPTIARISLVALCIAGSIWLGGVNIRAIIGFDLLQTGTLDFKTNIHPYVERMVFALIAQSSVVVDLAYLIVWVSAVAYLRSTTLHLREEGWLMMSVILFFLFTPVEVYTAVLDGKMWYLDHIGSNDLVEFRKIFIHRLGALAGVPMIALLSYYTIICLAIFRPMKLKFLPDRLSSSRE
jgi:hypothetical protein